MVGKSKILRNCDGFTLIEVMIALAIFAIFITSFMSGQSSNVLTSISLREDSKLLSLCQNKLNKVILIEQDFEETLLSEPETKTFEDHENYQYSVEYKKFELPEYDKIKQEKATERSQEKESGVQKQIYSRIKTNLEKVLWQIEVTVKNKETGQSYALSTWIMNQKEKINLGL